MHDKLTSEKNLNQADSNSDKNIYSRRSISPQKNNKQKSNNSKYGLGANIYTSDLSEGIRAAEQFEAGMVWVNAPLLDNDAGPFGGTKLSGMGRQLGAEGLETFRDTKTVMIDPDCQPQDFWWFPYPDEEMYKK